MVFIRGLLPTLNPNRSFSTLTFKKDTQLPVVALILANVVIYTKACY